MEEGEPPLEANDEGHCRLCDSPSGDLRPGIEALDGLSAYERKQRLLGMVALRVRDVSQLEAEIAALVSATHEVGASWREIGAVTGISGQVARRKWNPVARQQWAEYQRRYQRRLRRLDASADRDQDA